MQEIHRSLELLLPAPQSVAAGTGVLRLGSLLTPRASAAALEDPRAHAHLERGLARLRLNAMADGADAEIPVVLNIRTGGWQPLEGAARSADAYRLHIDSESVLLEARASAGLFHGVCTLLQLLKFGVGADGLRSLPCVTICDEPVFAERGFMLDVSRDRVPTMDAVRELVERCADWKLNQLQLYTEHTFAYSGHAAVWRDASPFTPVEIRELDEFCHARHIELVPNQNCFGHFHRWLTHPDYAQLAELPEGVPNAFSIEPEPFSLCPTNPGSLKLVADLLDQLLPCFRSERVNVGLDETLDLGMGGSKEACARSGKGRVYLDYVHAVQQLCTARGKRMQFWGDMILEYPLLVSELPQDALALEWGYEAGHPFDEHAARFASSGLDFYVVPGTSNWQSIGGRIDNARANLAEAAAAGMRHGALGYLITEWGDWGHWQPECTTWPGLLIGAGHAWSGTRAVQDPRGLLKAHLLQDGRGAEIDALWRLGHVHRAIGAESENGTPLFFILRYAHEPLPHERFPQLTEEGLRAGLAELEAVLSELGGSQSAGPAAARMRAEIEWACTLEMRSTHFALARLAAGAGQSVAAIPRAVRDDLRAGFDSSIADLAPLWLHRSRPGGLADSQNRLAHVSQLLA